MNSNFERGKPFTTEKLQDHIDTLGGVFIVIMDDKFKYKKIPNNVKIAMVSKARFESPKSYFEYMNTSDKNYDPQIVTIDGIEFENFKMIGGIGNRYDCYFTSADEYHVILEFNMVNDKYEDFLKYIKKNIDFK